MFTEPLLTNDYLFIRLLHNNSSTRLFRDLYVTNDLYATLSCRFPGRPGANYKTSVRIAGDLVEIRTEYLLNTSLKRLISYHFCFVFGRSAVLFSVCRPPMFKNLFSWFSQ
jgi:hypothetical protein